ncbi:unnamed protein product [Mytilus coruscus]|uniref:Reverse transcriptase domain-containing protein n=1 Tax=Mytilus coruscus TaxID=42192 RepID=A0A6J8DH71_MYTCO|nr:unnamed protein product [Mytilus coruscus]
MKRLSLDFDTNFSGQSELAETSKDKNVKFKSEKVTSEQELLQQLKKLNLAKGSVSKTNQHRRKHSDSKSQKVVQLPESVLRGNSSTESESETSSTSSSEDSSDYELSAKLSSKKKSKKLKSGLKIKSADKYEYVSKDLEFKQLNFKMLVAGELEIINNFCKNKSEKQGRLKLLQKIAYFSSIYHWASVLEFYAAWLRLIELGRKAWSDDSQMLENVMLSGQSLPKEGKSVNDGIDKNVYYIELHYPNVDNFIEIIKEKGEFCKIFKRDLRRAYRQIPVDPKDYNLIGFSWKGHYFVDRVLPMGLKSSAFICQTVTNAVRFIAKNHDISLINYLDDFAGAEISEKADISYKKLKWVLDSCGLEESVEKASSPSHRMSFLGVWFDTEKMTMEVTPDRLVEIFDLVSFWLNKDTASLKEVQSLIGKLNFIASCVRPGRIFISRILNFLREFKNEDCVLEVSLELKHDLLWWSEFLEIYNGVSLLNLQEWTEPDEYMASDACLVGCGGVSNGQFFHCVFPDFIVQQNLHINALELLSVIVCLKLWGQKGRKICIQCDNMVSVQVINQGNQGVVFTSMS